MPSIAEKRHYENLRRMEAMKGIKPTQAIVGGSYNTINNKEYENIKTKVEHNKNQSIIKTSESEKINDKISKEKLQRFVNFKIK
jgi:hypothetical protein